MLTRGDENMQGHWISFLQFQARHSYMLWLLIWFVTPSNLVRKTNIMIWSTSSWASYLSWKAILFPTTWKILIILLKRSQVIRPAFPHMNLYIIRDGKLKVYPAYMSQRCPRFGKMQLVFSSLMVLVDSFLAWSDARPWVMSLRTIFACFSVYCGTYFSIAQSKDGHLSSRRTASYFLPCPLGSRTKFSIFMENCSHFDWWNPKMSKTIRGIPNCGAPAGCSSVVIVPREERSASGEHQGEKKSRFSVQKGQKSSVSLQAVGKCRKTFFHLQTKTILAWLFSPPFSMHSAIKTRANRNRPE